MLPDFNQAPWLLPLAVLVGWLTLAFALAYGAVVLLALLLLAWEAAVKLARWGMGQRPMEDLSRATYPTARGAGCLARGCQQCPDATQGGGDGRRRDKHGADPRSTAAAQAQPHSSLINRTAAAGDPSQVLGAGGSESGGKQSFLEESVPPPSLSICSHVRPGDLCHMPSLSPARCCVSDAIPDPGPDYPVQRPEAGDGPSNAHRGPEDRLPQQVLLKPFEVAN